jgi:protein transport protein SEC24
MPLSKEQAAMGPPVGPPPTGGPPTSTQSVFSGKPKSRYPEMPAIDVVESQPSQQQAMPTHPSSVQPAPSINHHRVSDIASGVGRMQAERKTVESFSLLEQKLVVPPYPKELTNPEIDNKKNCPGHVFSCTLNAIPETQSLLDKCRLPFGIHLHPFKELPKEDLPVIQNEPITRCRSCRTYINPFVPIIDQRRWQCNVCFRTNDSYEDIDYPRHGHGISRDIKPEMRNCIIEYVAPSEYMVRPPQPCVFMFVLDVSNTALETGYLPLFCKCLCKQLDNLPGDSRMMIGLMTFNSSLHYYSLKAGLSQPQMMVISDLDDQFFPSPEGLLVNLKESRELVESLLEQLPSIFNKMTVPFDPNSAVGPALLSAFKLVSPHGGRVTLIQTTLPNCGEGQLKAREDSSQLHSRPQDVLHLQPATDFYKKLALDCSQQQVAIDLFLLSSKYCDLSSMTAACKFSSGCINYYRNFSVTTNPAVARKFEQDFCRYLTRPVGFEAVMRIRCTRGLVLQAFHGNCFIRSTDLLSLPNVNPDLGFSIQLAIEESLKDIPYACFQAALLYTSSKGERRIRVHTLVLPITNNLQQIYANANQHAIIGMVSKMGRQTNQPIR